MQFRLDLDEFGDWLHRATYQEIGERLAELARADAPEALAELENFLVVSETSTYGKHAVPRLTARALLQKGPAGVHTLGHALAKAPGQLYTSAIREALWTASEGKAASDGMLAPLPIYSPLDEAPPPDAVHAAKQVVHDLLAESFSNETEFDSLVAFLYEENRRSSMEPANVERFRKRTLKIIQESTVRITYSMIDEFATLLSHTDAEERYQCFLMERPILVDPLACEVISRQRLGMECVTDFVVKRLDNQYVATEIAKPSDRIFTTGSDFSPAFTHGFGQVLDFQQWVCAHTDYARTFLPGISNPRGMLIFGRSHEMKDHHRKKLDQFRLNSATIEILTYDDLLHRARVLYENLIQKI